MPNDARIEELAAPIIAAHGIRDVASKKALFEALRAAIREAREGQIRKDAEIVNGFQFAWLAAQSLLEQLPTKKG